MRPFFLLLFTGACSKDHDFDGFAGDDCDDSDATIYPGAPDEPGDGIDSDCDGEDAKLMFIGDWEISYINASYFSIPGLIPEESSGSVLIHNDLTTDIEATLVLDENLIGVPYTAEVELHGTVSRVPESQGFTIYADGDLLGEKVNIALDCSSLNEEILCDGGLKALEISFDLTMNLTNQGTTGS